MSRQRLPFRLSRSVLAGPLLALAVLATPGRAGDEDYYLSVPGLGALYRLDAETGELEPFVTGLQIPFYGVWATDGLLYLPDRELGAIYRIGQDASIAPFAFGGWLESPVTVVQLPSGDLVASDIFSETIVRLDASGEQTLLADAPGSGGLISGPGGLAVGPDGTTLYVSNNLGNTISALDVETLEQWQVSDGQGLLGGPGGIVADGAGNLFVANYSLGTIVRVRADTGEAEVFCDDPYMLSPNDVRLSRHGGLDVTTKNSSLVHIDALGQLAIVKHDSTLGDFDGVAVPADHPPCSGRFEPWGAGLAGSGGIVPRLQGIFSPCPGAAVALDARDVLGGAQGAIAYGLASASLPFKGGTLLVDITSPGGLIPLVFPGVGPGGGRFVLPFAFPDSPGIVGLVFHLQVLALDPGAPVGVSFSNGLRETIGS
jgi:hypothetical protein